jgi:antitoxin MazE
MKVQVQKWGNSLALRIPKSFATESSIEQGTTVDVAVKAGQLIVTPVPKKKYTLDELLAGVTNENRHDEVDTGVSVGREMW